MSFDFALERIKNCSTCKLPVSIGLFSKRRDTRDGLAYTCKPCMKDYLPKYLKTYDSKQVHRNGRKRKSDYIRSLKNKPCIDCGNQYEPFCMDFDHIIGEKKYNVGQMADYECSIDTINLEIAKTELICVLCHRDRTHARNPDPCTLNKWTQLNRKTVFDAKNGPCVICNKQYNSWQMDLDHLPGVEKKFNIAKLMNSQRHCVKALTEEISKCQLLCALCHRRKTAQGRGLI